ncbi:MAG: pyridoxamine 5'-phosphate oxidase family protein [Actinomycetota bacterium]
MTDAEIDDFLAGRRVMNTATIGPTGRPHLVAMWYGWAPDGRLAFHTYARSQKIQNLRRNPALTALVEDGEAYNELRGVQLACDAEITDDRETVNAIAESTYERYNAASDGPLTDDTRPFLHAYVAKRVGVLLDVVETASWSHAKLPAG